MHESLLIFSLIIYLEEIFHFHFIMLDCVKGAEKNHSLSLYYVGLYYEYGAVVETDLQKAFEYYQKAADLGLEQAIERVKILSK